MSDDQGGTGVVESSETRELRRVLDAVARLDLHDKLRIGLVPSDPAKGRAEFNRLQQAERRAIEAEWQLAEDRKKLWLAIAEFERRADGCREVGSPPEPFIFAAEHLRALFQIYSPPPVEGEARVTTTFTFTREEAERLINGGKLGAEERRHLRLLLHSTNKDPEEGDDG